MDKLISIIIPTFNRGPILLKTIDSYIAQSNIGEIIIVDDGSTNNSEEITSRIINKSNLIKYIKIEKRQGAIKAKQLGIELANFDYLLIGEDDVILAPNYTLELQKLLENNIIAIASGLIIYLQPGEDIISAKLRLNQNNTKQLINEFNLSLVHSKYILSPQKVLFTHALFMTKKKHFISYHFDEFYAIGNGFREETDYQIYMAKRGLENIVTNKTECYHLNRIEIGGGGQTTARHCRLFFNVRNTFYLINKYAVVLSQRLKNNPTKMQLKIRYLFAVVYYLYIYPLRKFLIK